MKNKDTNQLIEETKQEFEVIATLFSLDDKQQEAIQEFYQGKLTQVATHKEQEVLEKIKNIKVEAGNGGLGNFVKEAIIKSLEKYGN